MNKPKILAYFLPQFHTIPENDEWWGKGFTEWTNVKKENSASDNIKPLNDNYYNLLDRQTVEWQTNLAKEYGVHGFVYYHYYFNGKKLLEKPAENLITKYKDINQKFCFNWANHSWNRSWQGSREVLQEQEYGTKEDWKIHFDYLLDFFLDERYIKIDNKPVFIVFDNSFKEKIEMFNYFNELAKQNGLEGIYFIETLTHLPKLQYYSGASNAALIREPSFSSIAKEMPFFTRVKNKLKRICKLDKKVPKKLKILSGDKLVQDIVNTAKNKDKLLPNIKSYLAAFSSWDSTPRHGMRGYKITAPSRENYIAYLKELKIIAENSNTEFIFFNAWNEWAEGMVLEPDTTNKYMFLEGIKEVFLDNEQT